MSTEQNSEEIYLRAMIETLRRDFEKAIQPYAYRLIEIERMRIRPITVPLSNLPPELIKQIGERHE